MALAAFAAIIGTSLLLYSLGRRFARGFVAEHGAMPPLTWMFRASPNPELERLRRQALLLLPIDLVAGVVYILTA